MKIRIPFCIGLLSIRFKMLCSVQFDNQIRFCTIEICDIITDYFLTMNG